MRDDLASQAKSVVASALAVLAGGLQVVASAAQQGAEALRPPTDAGPGPSPSDAPAAAAERSVRGATVIGDLAHRPAREIIDEVDRLSPDELRRLREREQLGKQRKTVLNAVDNALAAHPPE